MSIKQSDKTYIEISKQRLSSVSRLNIYNIFRITETNQTFLNHFRSFEILDDIKNDNRYFDVIEAGDTEWWDNISHEQYGSAYYWFILCEMNDIVNPYEEIEKGQKIKVLKIDYLYEIFRDMKEISKL